MATKKAATKKATKKRKKELVDDPPIIVGGGGSSLTTGETFIYLPKNTPKLITLGAYDIYRVGYDVKTIVTKLKKNGTPKKNTPTGDGWDTEFYKTDE